jgi:hypothetical protein
VTAAAPSARAAPVSEAPERLPVRSPTPVAAASAHAMSSRRRAASRASASGPTNCNVTAVPSGMRAIASKKQKFIAAIAAPNAPIVSHDRADRPRRRGRASASTTAAATKRSAPVPAAPNAANTVVARAAAACNEAQLATMNAGPTRRGAKPATVQPARRRARRPGGPVRPPLRPGQRERSRSSWAEATDSLKRRADTPSRREREFSAGRPAPGAVSFPHSGTSAASCADAHAGRARAQEIDRDRKSRTVRAA